MALVETLVDSFSTLAGDVWTTTGAAGAIGGRLDVTPWSTYGVCRSVASFTLTASSVFVEVPQLCSGSAAEFDTEFALHLDDGNKIQFVYDQGTLIFRKKVASSNVDTSIAYNASTMRWWKFSEAGGTVTWWTAPDGLDWTSRRTFTWTEFSLASLKVDFQAGWWSGGSPTITNHALYDNLNSPSPVVAPSYLNFPKAMLRSAV